MRILGLIGLLRYLERKDRREVKRVLVQISSALLSLPLVTVVILLQLRYQEILTLVISTEHGRVANTYTPGLKVKLFQGRFLDQY